ncbi:glycosyl hydrolase [Bacteroidales bacterium]|nr:glycosyl hydrolase [Bacteroidales bacterium]
MRKSFVYFFGVSLVCGAFTACGEGSAKNAEEVSVELAAEEGANKPSFTEMNLSVVDISTYHADKDGYITIFDGKTFAGWRGYGKENVPSRWVVDGDAIKFSGKGEGEAQDAEGGDLIFAHKFKNFTLEMEWKVSKGANSGIFYLAREIESDGKVQPIYVSAPECQVLDNVNHVDASMGKDGNRQSTSLYDMIAAKPQNSKPFGEWNTVKIIVSKGTVVHNQNGVNVLEYHLWTPQWTEMLQASKFSEEKWPLAFELLNNCGGDDRKGFIGLQDHGDDVWFRNIKVKIMD